MVDQNNESSFFGFTRFVTPSVVVFLFALGVFAILAVAASSAFNPVKSHEFIGKNALLATGSGLVSLVVWRIVCEFVVVVFHIHDHLKQLAEK